MEGTLLLEYLSLMEKATTTCQKLTGKGLANVNMQVVHHHSETMQGLIL